MKCEECKQFSRTEKNIIKLAIDLLEENNNYIDNTSKVIELLRCI